MIQWANDLAAAWLKYKDMLIAKGGLIQADIDEMTANAASLKAIDASQETAKHDDAPEATAAANQAMADVEAEADFIYGTATAEYAKNPEMLGKFEALKPLRYSVDRTKKETPVPTPTDGPIKIATAPVSAEVKN
ncbi:MAG TPA: hypothetical protein VMU30_11350 [Bacteroidota bacterium]|nr:hypothetical protein [Bacteroidota bacterium]